jgi:hypothetical protein
MFNEGGFWFANCSFDDLLSMDRCGIRNEGGSAEYIDDVSVSVAEQESDVMSFNLSLSCWSRKDTIECRS